MKTLVLTGNDPLLGDETEDFIIYHTEVDSNNILAINVTRSAILSSYTIDNFPDNATKIILVSTGRCSGSQINIDVFIS